MAAADDGPPPIDDGPPLVDEAAARWAAGVVTPRRRVAPEAVAALRGAVASDLEQVDAAARAWTGLGADLPPTSARVVGRAGFVSANLSSLRGAFEPLRARLGDRPRVVASRVLGVQLGSLLGLLSAKVLGQYVLPLSGPGRGQLIVVGPNVLDLTDEHGALADDIRRSVLLHEVTHRLQFDATPWLGGHLRGLLDRYMSASRVDAGAIAQAASRLPAAIAEARESGTAQPLLQTVLTEEQAAVIEEAQALMTLLEGHGNTAMFDAAERVGADADAVRETLASRRSDVISKVLTAVANLEMKRRQYSEGEAFVRAVIAEGGVERLNLAFAAAENLPQSDEVGDPEAWLARVKV